MASVQKAKNGKYKLFYTDPVTRKRTSKSPFDSPEEAYAWLEKIDDSVTRAMEMTFSEFVELCYLPDYAVRVRPTTYTSFMDIYRAQLKPFFGKMKLNSITPLCIRRMQNILIQKGYAYNYITTIHADFSKVWNYGINYYDFPSNPAKKAGKPQASQIQSWAYDPSVEENELSDVYNVWSPEEFHRAMDEIISDRIEWTAFQVMFGTGCRVGECLGLQVRDYDPEARTLRINKTFIENKGKQYLGRPKTPESVRTVTLSNNLCVLLNDYIASMHKPQPSDRLFPSRAARFRAAIHKAADRSGVHHIPAKNLRHSHASYLINAKNAPIGKVSRRLGHKNINTTLRVYARWFVNDDSDLADLTEELYERGANE